MEGRRSTRTWKRRTALGSALFLVALEGCVAADVDTKAHPASGLAMALFIDALERSPQLQAAFLEDPEGVIRQRGLSEEEEEILLSRDEERIEEALGEPMAAERLIEWRMAVRAPWISPEAKVTALEPAEGRRGEVVPVTLFGAFFREIDLSVELRKGATVIRGDVSNVENPNTPQSSLDVTFSLGTNVPLGRYDVYVLAEGYAVYVPDVSFLIEEAEPLERDR